MSITHVTTHHLRIHKMTNATLVLRDEELSVDENKQALFDQLKNSLITRLNRKHGSFLEEEAQLPQCLNDFLSGQSTFSEISMQLMHQLESLINGLDIELDVHALFFMEENKRQKTFYLFVANQNESLNINEQLEVIPSYYVDTGISLFGIKVDVSEWQRRPKSAYLTLVPPRGQALLAEVFQKITGFNNIVDTEEATMAFLEGVDTFTQELDEPNKESIKREVIKYCKEKEAQDEPISIKELSHSLEGIDCEKFIKEMLPHNPIGGDELMLDRRSLKRYTRFSGREADLAVSFSSHQLNKRIVYDQYNDTLTIQGLPKSLRRQIQHYLQIE